MRAATIVIAATYSFRSTAALHGTRRVLYLWRVRAAAATPGNHPAQRTFDVLQEAQARAVLGERDTVRRMLDEAARLGDDMGEPPPFGYWYTPPFFRLNIGLAKLGLGEYRDAADLIGDGLSALPEEQRRAEWVKEYESALAEADDRA